MRRLKITVICAAIMIALSATAFLNRTAVSETTPPQTDKGNGSAVLELFTSEGCSSCPAADELLARVQQEAGDKPIYVLAYHVDYWNRLGWKDVFSDPQYSKRQYVYSGKFAGQVYTPQVIINGQSECVGSDESTLNKKVSEALNTPSAVSLTLQLQQSSGNIGYEVTGNTPGNQLLIAVVQKHAISKVERGENQGRTLSHAQIVRNLYTFDLRPGPKGTEHIHLPNNFNPKDWEIIGMIQDPESGVIKAAARASIASTTAAH